MESEMPSTERGKTNSIQSFFFLHVVPMVRLQSLSSIKQRIKSPSVCSFLCASQDRRSIYAKTCLNASSSNLTSCLNC